MTTSSIKMRVLTESIQKKVDALYKDNNNCSDFRNIVPQKYDSQKDWPMYLDNLFGDLMDKGHTPVSQSLMNECSKCKENLDYIQLQYNDYYDFTHKDSK